MRCSRLLVVLSMLALTLCASFTTANAADTGTWSAASPMAHERFNHQSVLLPDGRVLVVGGFYKDFNFWGSAEIFDPRTGSWSSAGALQPWGEDHRITLLHNGKVLVVGGFAPELYDPATNSWSKAGTPQALRRWATATLLNNGKVLVAGGHIGTADAGAELYDPETNSWSSAASMATARWCAAAVLLPDGKVLVAGGSIMGGETAQAEVYDPDRNTWTSAGWMASTRAFHTLTLLPGGKALAAGGCHVATAEIYDPATNTWSNRSVMPLPLYEHTATLLRDGTVLLVGGQTENNGVFPSSDAWLYDPATNSWGYDSSMSTGRFQHTAVRLPDGRVLVSGGRVDNAYWIQDATWVPSTEIWNPSKGTYTVSGTIRQGNATGAGLRGAVVSMGSFAATTDSAGSFSISAVPAGSYTVTISKSGYLTETISAFLVNGDMTGVDYYLVGPYSVSGTVREGSDSGAAVAGATVSVAGRRATTSLTGSFSVSGLVPGTYTVGISKAGYVTRAVTGLVVNSDISDLAYYLTPGTFTVGGMIRQGSSRGPGLEGATVLIGDNAATTGSTGAFSIADIPAGTYTMTISKSGFLTKTITELVVNRNMSAIGYYLAVQP